MQGHVLLKLPQDVSNHHRSNLSPCAWWDWLFLRTLQNIYVLICFFSLVSKRCYLKWLDTLYSRTWHCRNSRRRKSKATLCLLMQRPVDELSHSSNFPDSQLPHPSPCENINKHCFYYCGKLGRNMPPWSLPSSAYRALAPRGQRAALWSVRPGCHRMLKEHASGLRLEIGLGKKE